VSENSVCVYVCVCVCVCGSVFVNMYVCVFCGLQSYSVDPCFVLVVDLAKL
jgi:hypothetical protein